MHIVLLISSRSTFITSIASKLYLFNNICFQFIIIIITVKDYQIIFKSTRQKLYINQQLSQKNFQTARFLHKLKEDYN